MKSVKEQTCNNIEYIVIDGGSTDGTLDIIEENREFISKVVSEPDKGIYDAMNKGIDLATGEWLMFLNAGDVFSKNNCLSYVFESSIPNAIELVYGSMNVDLGNGNWKFLKSKEFNKLNLIVWGNRTVCHQSIFVRRRSVLKYDINYRIKGDFDWYFNLLKCLKQRQIKQVDLAIVNYQTGGLSTQDIMHGRISLAHYEHLKVLKKHVGLLYIIGLPIIYYGRFKRKFLR